MSRCVVNFAMGSRMGQSYVKGQWRLKSQLTGENTRFYTNGYPVHCPTHQDVPYAFKAYALKEAAAFHDVLLWCDSSVVLGSRPLADLWEKIERDGYWIGRNGFTNYEWTATEAYSFLFPEAIKTGHWEEMRDVNKRIPHVIATAFGLDVRSQTGRAFLDEYLRLAQTRAFCGPATNSNFPGAQFSGNPAKCAPCGPADVRGHRHDQTAASVIAWRLGMKLSDSPEWFAYRGGETDKTCLVADGSF